MTDYTSIIAGLSPERRTLLVAKLKSKGKSFNIFPLSSAQRRLWFLDRFDPGSPAYNIPLAVRIEGSFDPNLFEKVLQEIVRRHEILRTTFLELEGEPMQVIHPSMVIPLRQLELKQTNGATLDAEVARYIAEESAGSFDLASGPLLRAAILQGRDNDLILLLTMHHIVSDGWSMGILMQEIVALYAAFAQGAPSPLPPLALQYADFSEWQARQLNSDALQPQLQYWLEQLDGLPLPLDLPYDHSPNGGTRARGEVIFRQLPRPVVERLQALGRETDATLFMVLLAGLDVLLYLSTEQEDICVATPVANRTKAATEQLIGYFVNTLILRTKLTGLLTFRELALQVRSVALEAFSRQDLPFEILVERLNPSRNAGGNALFQVLFVLQNMARRIDWKTTGMRLTQLPAHSGAAATDLTVIAAETPAGLELLLEYNADRFDADTAGHLMDRFLRLLSKVADAPESRVGTLDLLTDAEREELRPSMGTALPEEVAGETFIQLFEAQASRTPDLPAVFYEGACLTYAELNARANRLARYLIRHCQAGPEKLIGIFMERSVEMVVAILAIWKSGSAYVGLDPSSPRERLALIAEDAQFAAVVTHHGPGVMLSGDVHAVDVTTVLASEKEGLPDDVTFPCAAPESLAYLIYTSGSTGRPKGVMIEHRSMLNLWRGLKEKVYRRLPEKEPYRTHPHLRVSLNAPLLFDASVQELVALLDGHCLFILPQEIRSDGEAMVAYVRRYRLDVFDCVPSQLKLMLEAGLLQEGEWIPPVLLPGGEAIDVTTWKTVGSQRRTDTFNMYGPTECTVDSTTCLLSDMPEKPNIGAPLANVTCFVLNRHQTPVPPGVRGELYIGGAGVGRGYWRRPDLTAERYLPDPFSTVPGQRLYRTGDKVRRIAEGHLEFLGRIDTQVKLRGFRIELGEIEAILREHDGVKDAAAIVGEDHRGDPCLAAYYVPRFVGGVSTPILREYLKGRLPRYMLPAFFIPLEGLPLTPSGKLDRRALPPLDYGNEQAADAAGSLATPQEELLAEIWKDVLGLSSVGPDSNFFDLGGHSLLAGRLAARVRAVFGIELPLRAVFEYPSVKELALCLTQLAAGAQRTLPPVTPVSREGPLPVSFAQQRLWFLDQLEPGSAWYSIPFVFRIRGSLNLSLLETSLNRVIAHHEALRSAIETFEGRPVLTIVPRLSVEIPVVDLSTLKPDERQAQERLLLDRLMAAPIPMDSAPLFRLLLATCGPEEHVLALVMHHCIADHWTAGILLRDIGIAYEALTRQKEPELPVTPVQYADFAAWQRRWLQGEALEAQVSYWREQLRDLPPLLELPTDRPRPAMMSRRGGYVPVHLPEPLAARVAAFSREEGSTPFITMLSAFAVLLERYSGQDDIAVGTPVAGRTHAELEGVVGLFVNTLVLRIGLAGSPSFRSLSRKVRETLLQAFARQDLPFEMVVDALGVERSMSHTPLFQVMFAYENAAAMSRVRQTSALQLEPVEAHSGTAKFDLSVSFAEEGNAMTGAWEYNMDLFDRSTIERMSAQYMRLLESALINADCQTSHLEMLSEIERQDLLRLSVTSSDQLPSPAVFSALFEQQVEKTPEAPAVSCGDEVLSYLQLNAKANRLAWHLIAHGIGPESLVGICMERSAAMVTALVGILKTGAAYVALDPTYPEERISMILEDAGIPMIVAHRGCADKLIGTHSTVDLDRDAGTIAGMHAGNPPVRACPENVAYLIYTSGSTGRPKGVMIQHGAMINLRNGLAKQIYARAGDGPFRITLNAPLLFDASVQQLVMLLDGHCLDILPQDIRADGEALVEYLRRRRVDVIDCVPSQLKLMLQAGLLDTGSDWVPKVLLPGGEAIDNTMWKMLSQAPVTASFNMYGPTECTVDSTICCVSDAPERPVIGRPLPNVSHYILDEQLMPVPAGVFGELCVGGAGVARGYLNRPELTAERFIPDPFARTPGSRLYRTGDMVRYLPDGMIEFKGRMDAQVKVRGFRIELGEIETALERHPAVHRCAVVARGDSPGGSQRLAAFLALREQTERPTTGELRDHLKKTLPEYMIPAAFVVLDTLPMTPNGKVNRKALPDPSTVEIAPVDTYAAPQTPHEEVLAEVWKEVLGVRQVGVNDNFFESGGDSILCILAVSRARKRGLAITPRQMFQYPTIAQLAAVVTAAAEDALEPVEDGKPIPLTPIQHWFFERRLANPHHWNQSVLFTIRRPLDPALLSGAVGALVQHHASLRLRFMQTDHGWRQSYATGGGAELVSVVDLESCPDDRLSSVIEESAEELQRSLNITAGPLIRVAYFSAGGERPNRLLIVIHHLAVDGVSWRILLEDLLTAYEQVGRGMSPALPSSSSFQRYARALVDHADVFRADDELSYWLAMLAAAQADIPVDMPAPVPLERSAETVSTTVDPGLTGSLLRDVPGRHRTRADEPLLAALVLAYSRWTGKRSLFISHEGHGRDVFSDELDLTRTVGWCTTMYPVLLSLGRSTSRVDALMTIREQLRAVPRNGAGYGVLRYLVQNETGTNPLAGSAEPRVCFNYLGQFKPGRDEDQDMFRAAPEHRGHERSPDASMSHLIDITCGVDADGLRISWTYSRDVHHAATIEHFASLFHEELSLLVQECLSTTTEEYVPSDFPMAGLTQDSLRAVLARVSQANER